MKNTKVLLSLPPNLVECFHDITGLCRDDYFCTNDPVGSKLGSGGGTNWLMKAAYENEGSVDYSYEHWLSREKRIMLHAGGQSRRLPSYAPSGKVLTPIPVFRWERGQRIGQNLLQLQLPLYRRIIESAPKRLNTLIASGDVYIRAGKLQQIPDADVVCYGLWVDPALAKNHGVFFSRRESPEMLDFVLQKPSIENIQELRQTHLFLMDIGIWLLSNRAMNLLIRKSTDANGEIKNYDLYSDFGQALGQNPTLSNEELNSLRVVVLPLQDGEFYHYGTSREMISSTMAIQNLVYDQRAIMHLGVKAHPSIFTQNTHNEVNFTPENKNTWIENSWIGTGWSLSHENIITGVPQNEWKVRLEPGQCVDMVPIGEKEWVLRPYGFDDAMRGDLRDTATLYLGKPVTEWLKEHHLSADEIEGSHDLQAAKIFPVCSDMKIMEQCLHWMLGRPEAGDSCPLKDNAVSRLVSANEISDFANLRRLQKQRLDFRRENLTSLSKNHRASVFYQTNLNDLAEEFHNLNVPVPKPLDSSEPLLKRINDQMFRSRLKELNWSAGKKENGDGKEEAARAFSLLRDGLTQDVLGRRQMPNLDVYSDQIVWGRSPVRIDLAGGWTDTPPYCLTSGGNVVNIAIELNGQPPLQTYVKPCKDYRIILRSIDLGAIEELTTWDELRDFARVGSPFSIPKAALALAGFLPEFCLAKYSSLEQQLREFGCGIEITLLSAIPAGSGLGTSSILAATVLGAVSNFCGLNWDKAEICNRTLVLEQLLTTGGGWQDQYGGVLHGVKMLTTCSGFNQTPEVRWLSNNLFTDPEYKACHLLYYTGITRTAKKILAEIVRNMFLYDTESLQLLAAMKEHSWDMYRAIMHGDFVQMAQLVGRTWQQNQTLDSGTNPAEVQSIVSMVQDLCYGLKLPGAGGGGYLYMIAKDYDAAARIRQILSENRPNDRARFVEMGLSETGLQISRS